MKISGFSFAWNVAKLYYPIEEAIRSILPICDEFVIAIGEGDADDNTREIVSGIGDPRIRIIDTKWTDREKLKGKIHGQQTNIALDACTGDWCFYVQADEVVHEEDLPVIRSRCEKYLADERVEGLIFDYLHFWGDYGHFHRAHNWYKREVRIVRNGVGIKSWSSAQSFRTRDDRKLSVAGSGARIFHYGWVRPPHLMQNKSKVINTTHVGKDRADAYFRGRSDEFDYGPMNRLARFEGTHPAVMKDKIAAMDWAHKLRDFDPPGMKREPHHDEKWKNRTLTFLENTFHVHLGNKNWRRLVK